MESPELDKAPRAVRENLLFAYLEGISWTTALYKQGGWARVSKAFAELPQSTEQIMHPDKYFAHEAPVKVMMPDITDFLNNRGLYAVRSVPPAVAGGSSAQVGWKKLDDDVQGEWGIYLMLDEFLKSQPDSRRAAAGWGGDRFAVYEGPKGEVLFTSLSSWDTESDARKFFDAYVKRTGLRYPGATFQHPPVDNAQSPPLSQRISTPDGVVVIELRSSRVMIIEGVPDRIDSRKLAKAILQ
jgi:hypothetical protein